MRIHLCLLPLLMLLILLPVQATPRADRSMLTEMNIMAPSLVGHVGRETRTVAVRDGYAYLGVGSRVAVFDVRDPAQPIRIGATSSDFACAVVHVVPPLLPNGALEPLRRFDADEIARILGPDSLRVDRAGSIRRRCAHCQHPHCRVHWGHR